MAKFQEFSQKLIHSLDPRTPMEEALAQTVADQQWRLNRVRAAEDGMLASSYAAVTSADPEHPEVDAALAAGRAFLENSKTFLNLTVYEQRIHRIMEKALEQLRRLQAERQAREQAQLEEAIKLENLAQLEKESFDPQQNGFVYSKSQIETECTRHKRLREADFAWRSGRSPRKPTAPVKLYD
jgi:hypothetical protein